MPTQEGSAEQWNKEISWDFLRACITAGSLLSRLFTASSRSVAVIFWSIFTNLLQNGEYLEKFWEEIYSLLFVSGDSYGQNAY